jgi:Na+/melibiose symporter-like transporter
VTATAEPALSEGWLRRVLAVLCGTQIVSWGVLYYAFPVMAPSIADDTGWPIATITAAFFAPLTATLLSGLGWRHTYLALAAVLAVVTIPAHLLGLRGPWPDPEPADDPPSAVTDLTPAAITHSQPFLLLTAAVGLAAFTAYAVVVNQVPLLLERGLSTSLAAWALGLGGLGQVLGRLGYSRLTAHLGVRIRGVVILALSAAATALLAVLPGPPVLLVAAAMLAGAARGVFTLLQATAISDRWGAVHYGRINGLLSVPPCSPPPSRRGRAPPSPTPWAATRRSSRCSPHWPLWPRGSSPVRCQPAARSRP